VRPILADHGLSATWTTQIESPYPYKVCKLAHELGHVESAACPIIIDENAGKTRDGDETLNSMQKYGIADTYAERYSFEAVCGLVSSEVSDTDGAASAVEQPKPTTRRRAPSRPAKPAKPTPAPAARAEDPPHTAENTQPPPAGTGSSSPPMSHEAGADKGTVLVQAVSWKPLTGFKKNGDAWRKVIMMASDGLEYSTWSKSDGIILEAACPTEDHAGEWLQIEWEKGRYGPEVTLVDVAQGPPE